MFFHNCQKEITRQNETVKVISVSKPKFRSGFPPTAGDQSTDVGLYIKLKMLLKGDIVRILLAARLRQARFLGKATFTVACNKWK